MNTETFNKRLIIARIIIVVMTLTTLSIGFAVTATKQTHAAPVVGFNPGNIIDDMVFTNSNTMSPSQIQAFLNSKVPVCDTNGVQISEYGGGTRAQWGAAHYGQSVFICLKDYSENGKTSSQIIYDVSQEFQINPQVLIVLLQKEQGLVTDTWPLNVQYRSATGYGCPDTAPCDAQYYGLTNQVRWSARMFRAIYNVSPTWYTPYILGNNFIQYNPNTSCGGSIINIQNRATQSLYNYTPYQPNQSALNVGYGVGDSCGAYGNRNFYLYFTDWFGSVRSNDSLVSHPDGTLVSMDGRIYIIKTGTLHYLANATIFESYNYRWEDVKPATTGDRNLTVSWPIDFINPALLYRSEGTGVYSSVLENGKWVKQIVSQASFVALGYDWRQVRLVPSSDTPVDTSSTVFFSNKHLDGTLIKNASGVFIVDNGTRRYITPAVFASHRWLWSDIVNESPGDSSLPLGANALLREGAIIADTSNLYVVQLPMSGPEIKRPIGPWYCYASVFRYTIGEVILMEPQGIPALSGSLVSC